MTIAKEIFPDYQLFFERQGWGDPDLLAEGIALDELSTIKEIDPEMAKALAAKIYQVTPDTGDFGDWDGSYALNAAACVVDLLTYIADKDPKHPLDIGTFYYDTIYFRLKEMGIEAENDIDDHPEMRAARQKLLLLSQ